VSVTAGQPAVITYSVSNLGLRDAVGVWYETLYLSVDAYLDPYDTRLTTVRNLNYLSSNSAYTQNVNVFVPFGLVSGKYYLFYQVDGGNRIPENNKKNNIISNVITIAGTVSTDLAVIQVQTFPGIVHYGDCK
jgi:subtilase family serine protease